MSVKTAKSFPLIGDPRSSPYAAPTQLMATSEARESDSSQPATSFSPGKDEQLASQSLSGEAFRPTRAGLAQGMGSEVAAQSPRVQLLKKQLSARSSRAGYDRAVPLDDAAATHGLREVAASKNVGLNNLGNTCFMNSALQCILHIEPLIKVFLNGSYVSDLNEKSPTKGAVAISFAHLLSDISKASSGSRINPQQFQKAICIYAPHLLDEEQQDCQEFLRFLLDGMSDDLFRRAKRVAAEAEVKNHKRNAVLNSITGRGSSVGESTCSQDEDAHQPTAKLSLDRNPLMSASAPLVKALAASGDDSYLVPNPPKGATSGGRPQSSVAKLRSITGGAPGQLDNVPFQERNNNVDEQESDHKEMTLELSEDSLSPCDASPYNSPVPSHREGRLDDSVMASRGSVDHDFVLGLSVGDMSVAESVEVESIATAPLTHSHADCELSMVDEARSSTTSRQMKDRPQRNEISHHAEPLLTVDNVKEASSYAAKDAEQSENVNVNTSTNKNDADTTDSDSALSNARYEAIARKAASESWGNYLSNNDSIITDLFSGQLQNTVECLVCHHKSFAFDPFLDLSVPIPSKPANVESSESPDARENVKPSKWRRKITAATGRRSNANTEYPTKCSLEECIAKFTADELLEGDNMYTCEKCKKRQKCVRKLAIYKCPEVLVVHIKRFQYTSIVREKLFTDVQFPLSGLDMAPFLSTNVADPHSSNSGKHGTIYDLCGVVHHSGGINGGHYVAHVAADAEQPEHVMRSGGAVASSILPTSASGKSNKLTNAAEMGTQDDTSSWVCFNDAHVSPISPKHIVGPSAYVLFYKLRK